MLAAPLGERACVVADGWTANGQGMGARACARRLQTRVNVLCAITTSRHTILGAAEALEFRAHDELLS